MSDEYASSGFKGSLVNECPPPSSSLHARAHLLLPTQLPPVGAPTKPTRQATTPPRATVRPASPHRASPSHAPRAGTSSGGYGAGQSSWSTDAQRGRTDAERASAAGGLVDQSTSGGGLAGSLQDAQQGRDTSGAPGMAGAQGLDPYGKNPDSREEAAEMLAHGSADRRGEQFESGPAGSVEQGNLGA
jgi:hypothetical protein